MNQVEAPPGHGVAILEKGKKHVRFTWELVAPPNMIFENLTVEISHFDPTRNSDRNKVVIKDLTKNEARALWTRLIDEEGFSWTYSSWTYSSSGAGL